MFAVRSVQFAVCTSQSEVEDEVAVELNWMQYAVDYARRKVEEDGVVGGLVGSSFGTVP